MHIITIKILIICIMTFVFCLIHHFVVPVGKPTPAALRRGRLSRGLRPTCFINRHRQMRCFREWPLDETSDTRLAKAFPTA